MLQKVLLVVHQARSDPGRVGQLLMERGYCLDIRCPNMGHRLPERVEDYSLVAIFGGPMSANDCHMRGIRYELDWMPRVLDTQVPYLGICLGAQMLARVLGATVRPHPEGMVEFGYTTVHPTAEGTRYFDGPMTVYQAHKEGFEVPGGACLLAQGQIFANQAFRYGDRAYGLQFHPEVTLDIKQRWVANVSPDRLARPGAQPPKEHIEGHARHDPALDRWIRRFLDHLLRLTPGADQPAEATASAA